MKRFVLILLLATSVSSCHAPVTIVTPAGKTAYTVDQVVNRINELENAAIQANSTKGLDTNTTRTIVTWCVNADTTLSSTPSGYMATITTAWSLAKGQIKTTNPAIIAAMAAVDIVLGVSQ